MQRFLTKFIYLSLILTLCLARYSHESSSLPDLDCYAIGPCSICTPEEAARESSCVETGNREPVECVPINNGNGMGNGNSSDGGLPGISRPPKNVVKTWRSCSKVKSLEKFYFFKFQTLNIAVTVGSACLMVWRKRQLDAAYQRRLTRRVAQV
ncbi:MAG: hypothetical protein DHS80DRAFT_31607 [Piptocephalis tieghemiana]|nr:MAG: hypothetical protein DHS80DRAFT_31607 [Piptocephalis tieghemiana]